MNKPESSPVLVAISKTQLVGEMRTMLDMLSAGAFYRANGKKQITPEQQKHLLHKELPPEKGIEALYFYGKYIGKTVAEKYIDPNGDPIIELAFREKKNKEKKQHVSSDL